MDKFDTFTSKPSTTQENDLFGFENTDEITNNQNDDSSPVMENNSNFPTSFPSDISSTHSFNDNLNNIDSSQTLNPTDDSLNNIDSSETLNSSNDTLNNIDSSQTFNPFNNNLNNIDSSQTFYPFNNNLNNIDSSQTINPFNENLFENDESLYTLPPTAEDILSDNSIDQQSEHQSSWNMFSNEVVLPIQILNKKREEEIATKDAEEKRKIDELRQQAKNDLEHWYNERNKQMEQKRQTMKTEENTLRQYALEKSTKVSCDWSKVISLLDFTDGKQYSKSKRDLTRMKSCMFNAKRISDSKKLENGNGKQ
ncbi:unnamed protein product [Rotaria sordida]|uniref:Clathrin light chain n=1 Tax=Rotaria sordida TaxID=392033 RepID=A0A813ZKD5_9BILA|nr:unnamed protein product [Rotaria sordida]CAF3859094.1 unnamed protein product [Rotaria sordida]